MADPKEEQPQTVDGEYGAGYNNEKVPDPNREGEMTDHVVYDGVPVVGPQGE